MDILNVVKGQKASPHSFESHMTILCCGVKDPEMIFFLNFPPSLSIGITSILGDYDFTIYTQAESAVHYSSKLESKKCVKVALVVRYV